MTKEKAVRYLCQNHQGDGGLVFSQAMVEYEILKKHGLDREAKALAIKLLATEFHYERREKVKALLDEE